MGRVVAVLGGVGLAAAVATGEVVGFVGEVGAVVGAVVDNEDDNGVE